jgi:hypothetical protein
MSKAATSRTKDPLLAALIAKLPPSSEPWSEEAQLLWLQHMAMAFSGIYGGAVAARLGVTSAQGVLSSPTAPVVPKLKPAKPTYKFYIDSDSYVRNQSGKRILPKDVTDLLIDTRGSDSDVGSITWADDTQGINGVDVTIVLA